jgi:hypothetical protein
MTSREGEGGDCRRRAIECNPIPPPVQSFLSSSSSPVVVIFLSSPGRDSLEFKIDGSPDGKNGDWLSVMLFFLALCQGAHWGFLDARHMQRRSPERQEEQRIGIASQRGGSGEYDSTISYCDCKALDIRTPPP